MKKYLLITVSFLIVGCASGPMTSSVEGTKNKSVNDSKNQGISEQAKNNIERFQYIRVNR
jgi:uncharacterized protein YcfL